MGAWFDLPGYVDLELIGAGGYGRVFRARQPAFDRQVAIKLLIGRVDDEATLRRFQRECQALGSVSSHPNIVPVYDAGESPDGEPYLVMDFVEGGSLADLMNRSGPLSWCDVAEIGVKLSGALHSAHAAGVLHRDIKPDNILLSDYGEPQLADFGIAQKAGIENRTATASAMSPLHASMEQFSGGPPSELTDIYALASTLFTLLAGRSPFEGNPGESIFAVAGRAMTEPPPDLRLFGVPDPLARVIEQGLSKDPAARPESAVALGRLLQGAQAAMNVPVTPLPVARQSGNSPGLELDSPDRALAPDEPPESDQSQWVTVVKAPLPVTPLEAAPDALAGSGPVGPDRRRPWYTGRLAAGLAVLVLITIGVSAWKIASSGSDSKASAAKGVVPHTPVAGTPTEDGEIAAWLLQPGDLNPVQTIGWKALDQKTAADRTPGMPATCYNPQMDAKLTGSTSLQLDLPSSPTALVQVMYRGAPDSTRHLMSGLRSNPSCRFPGQTITQLTPARTPGLAKVKDQMPGDDALAFQVVAHGKTFYEMFFRKDEIVCAVVWNGPYGSKDNWSIVWNAARAAADRVPS